MTLPPDVDAGAAEFADQGEGRGGGAPSGPAQDADQLVSVAAITDGPPEALSEQVDAILYEAGLN